MCVKARLKKLMMHLYSLTETSLISMETFSLTSVGLCSAVRCRLWAPFYCARQQCLLLSEASPSADFNSL